MITTENSNELLKNDLLLLRLQNQAHFELQIRNSQSCTKGTLLPTDVAEFKTGILDESMMIPEENASHIVR